MNEMIGQQLDAMGLSFDLPDDERVEEATVHLVTGREGHGREVHRPIRLPRQEPGSTPVPHPVERRIVTVVAEGQEISSEQRERVKAWLQANGIDPRRVALGAITVECTLHGDQPGRQVIGFTEYYETPDGQREMNWKTQDGALTLQRWVVQQVPIEPDPAWKGWSKWHAEVAAKRAEQERQVGDDD
ncbi:hypothetical protein ADL27_52020 [Streptomyces sp. NRRL F-6602]|nr:hypothetical protein ADL27_52020 [Streptomyces sp. NRRL F-6602]